MSAPRIITIIDTRYPKVCQYQTAKKYSKLGLGVNSLDIVTGVKTVTKRTKYAPLPP